jgi:hypothetical protein
MNRSGTFQRRWILVLAVVAALGTAAYVFTATNTVPDTSAGSGSGTISGYTITNVQYSLNATNPQNLDAVTFTISPTAASVVKIQLASGGSWYSCTNTSGSVSCTTTSPQATVAAATQLTVVATQ